LPLTGGVLVEQDGVSAVRRKTSLPGGFGGLEGVGSERRRETKNVCAGGQAC
jgi:hypothetical protein